MHEWLDGRRLGGWMVGCLSGWVVRWLDFWMVLWMVG